MTDQIPTPTQNTAPVAPPQRKRKSMLQELLETVLLTLVLFGIARFCLQNFMVQGTSMVPTLHDGEYILVDKVSYRFHTDNLPSRGDIIVFHSPPSAEKNGQDFIKRVIGLPGDTVAIKPVDGVDHVFVDGKMLDEPYISAPPPTTQILSCSNPKGCAYRVPPHDLFVMGDNRPYSYDSRMWGPLPLHDVIGRALIAYWPLKDFSILRSQYSTISH